MFEVSTSRAQSASEIELLKREHEFTRRKLKRVDELLAESVISKQEVDEVRTSQSAAKLRYQAATEKQQTARLEAIRDELALARRIVRSPIDGVVTRKYKSIGEYVDGDPILQLAQLDPLRIRVIVPMTLFGQIEVGMQATIVPELPIDGPFVATVTSIDPMVDAATATLGVRLSLPNPEYRLPAGLKCNLTMLPKDQAKADAQIAEAANATTALTLSPTPSGPKQKPEIAAAMSTDTPAVVKKEKLIADPLVGSPSKSDLRAKTNPATVAIDSSTHACLTLGPIASLRQAEAIAASLSADDVRFSRQYAANNAVGPWTVISRKRHVEPDRLIARLKEAGVSDVQWFKQGHWQGRMSYGVYGKQGNAQRHKNNLQALGFDTEVIPRIDSGSELLIDVESAESSNLHNNAIKTIQQQFPDLITKSAPCPSFESF